MQQVGNQQLKPCKVVFNETVMFTLHLFFSSVAPVLAGTC